MPSRLCVPRPAVLDIVRAAGDSGPGRIPRTGCAALQELPKDVAERPLDLLFGRPQLQTSRVQTLKSVSQLSLRGSLEVTTDQVPKVFQALLRLLDRVLGDGDLFTQAAHAALDATAARVNR